MSTIKILAVSLAAMLAGCASAPAKIIVRQPDACPRVTACTLPASSPSVNRHLLEDLERAERAWHECAAQVDAILDCQARADRTGPTP